MFLASDTILDRQTKVRSFISNEPVIAVILAAVDFEWTVRRAILALGCSPTKEITAGINKNKKGGLVGLRALWDAEVSARLHKSLDDVLLDFMPALKNAYSLRHKLVHGVQGTTGVEFASDAAETFLRASEKVSEYAESHGCPVYGRVIRRIKKRDC